MRIDSTDLKILSLLQENARISFSGIAAEVHLSTTAVTRRIELMQERGIIRGFRTMISPQAGGKTVHRSEERRVGKECRSRWSPYH